MKKPDVVLLSDLVSPLPIGGMRMGNYLGDRDEFTGTGAASPTMLSPSSRRSSRRSSTGLFGRKRSVGFQNLHLSPSMSPVPSNASSARRKLYRHQPESLWLAAAQASCGPDFADLLNSLDSPRWDMKDDDMKFNRGLSSDHEDAKNGTLTSAQFNSHLIAEGPPLSREQSFEDGLSLIAKKKAKPVVVRIPANRQMYTTRTVVRTAGNGITPLTAGVSPLGNVINRVTYASPAPLTAGRRVEFNQTTTRQYPAGILQHQPHVFPMAGKKDMYGSGEGQRTTTNLTTHNRTGGRVIHSPPMYTNPLVATNIADLTGGTVTNRVVEQRGGMVINRTSGPRVGVAPAMPHAWPVVSPLRGVVNAVVPVNTVVPRVVAGDGAPPVRIVRYG
eukprot:Lankesteria_metandrocarpae@DN814_c0_g1_i1.p1